MRVRCVIGLALALAAPAAPARSLDAETERAIANAFGAPGVVVVAERDGRGRGADKSWKRAPEWARRNLSPRALERATRDALRRIDPTPWIPPASPEPSRADEWERPEPVAAESAPAEPAPPPAVEEPVPDPMPATTPMRVAPLAPAPWHAHARSAALALALAALLATLAYGRRAKRAPFFLPPVAALPAEVELRPSLRTTRPRAAVDAAVATAVAAHAPHPDPFPVGDRYEIVREIGRGGMGIVYQARDKRLDRVVALKRLPDTLESEPRYVELLLREARSAARLNHPNIVTVHDVDRANGAFFITMEFLEGSSLEAILRERRRIAARSVVWAAEQVVAGLGYAHDRGIVHRDVKPANLFVTRDRVLKLMDFGVAKILEEARRKRTIIGGTPAYMAPEQAAGESVDGRADLYALGGTLFELLTGELPFAKGDPLHHHRETAAPDPRERVTGIPDALADLVLALLRKRPEERPKSAAEVAAELRRIAESLPPLRSAA